MVAAKIRLVALLTLLLPALPARAARAWPKKLSEWAMLTLDNGTLSLAPGVFPYALSTELFSDRTAKLRLIRLPVGTSAVYTDEEVLAFPVGTVIAKTFAYPLTAVLSRPPRLGVVAAAGDLFVGSTGPYLLLETRILTHQPEGWVVLPYIWQDGANDAVLALTGRQETLSLATSAGPQILKYAVPNANQCQNCHVTIEEFQKRLMPIGPRARFLNRESPWQGGNQLTTWASEGRLLAMPELSAVPRSPAAFDTSDGSMPERARAYLDMNCAHCHRPGGSAASAGLNLRAKHDLGHLLGICKTPVAAGNGGQEHAGYDITPGQPEHSLLLQRMLSTTPSVMMPELGRSLVDWRGTDLIQTWILGLTETCN